MATLAVTNDFSAGAAIVASEMNANFTDIETFINTTPGVLQLTGGTVTGAVTLSNTLTVGADDTGYDVKFFGATSGSYMLWDESADDLVIVGGQLGVGTASPAHELHVQGDTPTYQITSTNAIADSSSTETIADIDWEGQKNSLYRTVCRIRARANGTWSSGTADDADTALAFYANNGSGMQNVMAMTGSGLAIGVGAPNPDDLLHVWEASAGSVDAHADAQVVIENSGTAALQFLSAAGEENRIIFGDAGDNDIGGIIYDHNDNTLNFYASAGNAARFTHNASGGRLTLYGGSGPSAAEGGEIELDGGTSYSADFYFDRYGDDIRWLWGGVTKFNIASDGDLTNTNNSYGAISDERVKTDITPARDYLADLLNLEVVNFVKDKQFVPARVPLLDSDGNPCYEQVPLLDGDGNLTYEDGDQIFDWSETEGTFEALDEPSIKQLGMVAQQVEQHIAGLIKTDRFGVKSIKSSVLVPMLVQSVQTLTARIVALEAA